MYEFNDFLWRLSRQLAHMMGAQLTRGDVAEPFVEFSETDDGVVLTAEIPGTDAEDIKLRVSEYEIILSVSADGLTAYSETFETGRIDPGEAMIHYKNGILEVQVPWKKRLFNR